MTPPNEGERRDSTPWRPLTVDDLLLALTKLKEDRPEFGSLRVHLLDMEDELPEDEFSGLLTHVETDAMSREQGLVLSLMAWRHQRRPTTHNRRPTDG